MKKRYSDKKEKGLISRLWSHLHTDINNKNSKEPERNPYFMSDYCILKSNIEHQGIGGKKAYFEMSVSLEEIIEKATIEQNIACQNFIKRRPDLFDIDNYIGFTRFYIKPTAMIKPKAKEKRYHYVKIWNTNEIMYPEYTYLGYVICSDEIKKAYKVNK